MPESTKKSSVDLLSGNEGRVIYMLRKTHTLACGMKAAFLYLDR